MAIIASFNDSQTIQKSFSINACVGFKSLDNQPLFRISYSYLRPVHNHLLGFARVNIIAPRTLLPAAP